MPREGTITLEHYYEISYKLAKDITQSYSSSFGQSSKLFDSSIRKHIYAIYGLVRVADEIVDTYKGKDSLRLLKELEAQTVQSLNTGFSPNPIVHAFVSTARKYKIGKDLIRPFFKSMRMDIKPKTYSTPMYLTYIHGSAEVIGLMCLKVFTNDSKLYNQLSYEAKMLGSAYQKVNFLRDMKSDYIDRGRVYFPGIRFDTFNDEQKMAIINDIKENFKQARPAIAQLPNNCRTAVAISFNFYSELLKKLERTSAETIKNDRIRIGTKKKLSLLIKTRLNRGMV